MMSFRPVVTKFISRVRNSVHLDLISLTITTKVPGYYGLDCRDVKRSGKHHRSIAGIETNISSVLIPLLSTVIVKDGETSVSVLERVFGSSTKVHI